MSHYCGTITGARYHSRDNTPVCPPCRTVATRRLADVRKRRYLAGGSLVGPTIGTARRLRALARIGWSFPELGKRLGVTKEAVAQWARADETQQYVRLSTINRVAALYDELCMTPGGSPHATNRAVAKGWAPPLDWDEGAIDDPRAVPYCEVEAAHLAALREDELRAKRAGRTRKLERVKAHPALYEEYLRHRREQNLASKRRQRAREAEQQAVA